MLSQLIKDLVHLEGRENGFDQDGRADRPSRQPQFILREIEDIVPQASFLVALHLRQIKIRPATLLRQLLGVVEEEQAEVKQWAGDRIPIHEESFIYQMPAPGSDKQCGSFFSELILLSF